MLDTKSQDDEMKQLKPSRKFIAVAVQTKNGFFGQWAAPGMIPDFVRDYTVPGQNPPVVLFDTEEAAEFAALRVMRNALNDRHRSGSGKSRDTHFDKMTGAELAVHISEAGLNFTQAAELFGYTLDYLSEIINGAKSVPFIMHWAVPLLKNPENLQFSIEQAAKNMRRSEHLMERLKPRGITEDNLAGRINPVRRGQ